MSELVARDLYVKITDKHSKSHIECRLVYDATRFFQSLQDQHKKEGGKVEISSREAYMAERKRERQT